MIELKNVTKHFGEQNNLNIILNDFSLSINESQIITIYGPNGCGKTTLLNLISKFVKPESGIVVFTNKLNQKIGYVFQEFEQTLHPWKTVYENIGYPLSLTSNFIDKKKLEDHLKEFNLVEHQDKYIYELSGGLKQLTALAMATIYEPSILLLDEPFSKLDFSNSRGLRSQIRKYFENRSIKDMVIIMITHDLEEALFVGDRLLVLSTKPLRIVHDLMLPFGKNRNPEIVYSDYFLNIKNEIVKTYYANVEA